MVQDFLHQQYSKLVDFFRRDTGQLCSGAMLALLSVEVTHVVM